VVYDEMVWLNYYPLTDEHQRGHPWIVQRFKMHWKVVSFSKVLVVQGAVLRRMMLENRELGFNVLERLCFLLRDRIQSAYGAMEKI
jgi:hypothetical protein